MDDEELEAIRLRVQRPVYHVTPDHQHARALLAEVKRLREENLAVRGAESFLRDDVRCLRARVSRAAEDMRRRAVEACRRAEEAYDRQAETASGPWSAERREDADLKSLAVELLADEIAALPVHPDDGNPQTTP